MHQRRGFGDDDSALSIGLQFPALEAFLGRGQLLFKLLLVSSSNFFRSLPVAGLRL